MIVQRGNTILGVHGHWGPTDFKVARTTRTVCFHSKLFLRRGPTTRLDQTRRMVRLQASVMTNGMASTVRALIVVHCAQLSNGVLANSI